MPLDIRAWSSGAALLALAALGYPGPARAEDGTSLDPLRGDLPPASQLQASLSPKASDAPVPDPALGPTPSDGGRVESFSRPAVTSGVAGGEATAAEPDAGEPGSQPASPNAPVSDNAQVQKFLERFQTGYRRAVVERWLGRAGRYTEMIRAIFRDQGLPEDLMFTAMIESGFNPVATSRAGAKGLWQFMAPTARRYGLRVDRWVDERLDPEKSTLAAARYLRDLYAMFGSWELAKAAYNAGEMKVLRAMKALNTTDFWELTRGRHLREETKNFVPAIEAAAVIGREPERYGFAPELAERLAYETGSVPGKTTLKQVAALAGVPAEELDELNPELKLKQTPPGGAYPLKFPRGAAERYAVAAERERALAAERSRQPGKPEVHVVKAHETIDGIARRYGLSASALARMNQLDEGAHIRPGDRLRIVSAARAE